MMKKNLWLALGSFGWLACAPTEPVQRETALTLHSMTVDQDTWIDADRVIFPAGTHIRVLRRAVFWVRARTLVIEGPVELDASGIPGDSVGEWHSSDRCPAPGHLEWFRAQVTDEHRGLPGGDAAFVELRYQTLSGRSDDLQVNTQGGAGGPGMILRCGCHPAETKQGASGAPGADGAFTLVLE